MRCRIRWCRDGKHRDSTIGLGDRQATAERPGRSHEVCPTTCGPDSRTTAEPRHTHYAEVAQNGRVQVSVLTEADGAIEAEGIMPEAARPMLLALLIDLDPSGDIGETVDEIDLAG